MAYQITHHAQINQDAQTPFWTKIAPYISSSNAVLFVSTLAPITWNVKIFDFVINPNANPGFPGGNGATAANVMY